MIAEPGDQKARATSRTELGLVSDVGWEGASSWLWAANSWNCWIRNPYVDGVSYGQRWAGLHKE